MVIYLNPNVKRFTGVIDKSHGYYFRTPWKSSGKLTSFAQRMPSAPPDGHWRCICDCAALAQQGLIITGISLNGFELAEALKEAGLRTKMCAPIALMEHYTADRIIYLKETFNL